MVKASLCYRNLSWVNKYPKIGFISIDIRFIKIARRKVKKHKAVFVGEFSLLIHLLLYIAMTLVLLSKMTRTILKSISSRHIYIGTMYYYSMGDYDTVTIGIVRF